MGAVEMNVFSSALLLFSLLFETSTITSIIPSH